MSVPRGNFFLKLKGFLADKVLEAGLRLQPRQKNPVTRSPWAFDPSILKNIKIRWPIAYDWPLAGKWVDFFITSLQKTVKIEFGNIEQSFGGVVVFEIDVNGKSWKTAIDYSDYTPINEEAYDYCSLYFKMQYLDEGYGEKNIIPGGFVTNGDQIYTYLNQLRKMRDQRKFQYDVYGRFSLDFATDVRTAAVGYLSNQDRFSYEGGLKKVRYIRFLSEIAKSKVCIDLPGNGDFCFRLIDYLAVGACVIAKRHRTKFHIPLIDKKNIVYAKDDMSDLVDLCDYYVKNDDAREEVCLNSREFFDRHLHRDQLSRYYILQCIDAIKNIFVTK